MADKPNLDTPDAGDLNTAARKAAAQRGWAMPDGSFPIRPLDQHGRTDLGKAIKAVGRSGSSHDAVRRHIIKRARALGLSDQIPDNWSSSGSMNERSDGLERTRGRVSIPRDVPVEYRSAMPIEPGAVNFTERTIDLIAVPYEKETARPVMGPDGRLRPELVERGAFDGIANFRNPDGTFDLEITVNRDHKPERAVGKIVEYGTGQPDGLPVTVYVSPTALGDETLQLAHDRVLRGSVGMLVRRSDQYVQAGVRRIRRAFLDHLGLLPNPAWPDSKVLAVRSEGSDGAGVELRELDPADEAAWETAARIEAMASKIRRR